ncbi:MAG: hypothetical protein R2735_11840 [Microthrixaceae bacterium]
MTLTTRTAEVELGNVIERKRKGVVCEPITRVGLEERRRVAPVLACTGRFMHTGRRAAFLGGRP